MRHLSLLLALAALGCDAGDDTPAPDTDAREETDATDPAADNWGVSESEGDADCDNLADGHCMMPFPSDRWRDPATGRLALTTEALPEGSGGREMDPAAFDADGFGVASPLLFQLVGVDLQALPAPFDVEASLADDALTVLLDATTGERVPHWIEHDHLDRQQDPPVLTLRPAVPLPAGTRLVAGVRGLVDEAGDPVAAPEGFRALRDRQPSARRGVHARRAHYEDAIFPVLEDAGFAREDLQLAWDLTTRTDASAQRDLAAVQARLYEALGDAGPAYTIDTLDDSPGDPHIAVIVDGTAHVPSFLLPADDAGVRRLRRDEDGLPVAEGTEAVPFRLQVPHAAFEGDGPAPVLQYGHGFLGSMNEANNRWLRELADRHRFLVLAASMQGMSGDNAPVWMSVLLGDAGRMPALAEEPMQGIANHLALQRMMATSFLEETAPALQREGAPLHDPDQLWYYGNSQGGTMGHLVLTTSRDVTRGVLGVPGCCFPLLLQRSTVFASYAAAIRAVFPDPGDLSLIVALIGTGWDRLEGLTWAPRMAADPLPDTPPHQALLHVALEDAQVHNEASWVLARALDAVQDDEDVVGVWGVDVAPLPQTAPAVLTNWDFGVPPDATPNDPPVDATDTHGVLRKDLLAQDQMVHFLRTGEVPDACDGPCVRE